MVHQLWFPEDHQSLQGIKNLKVDQLYLKRFMVLFICYSCQIFVSVFTRSPDLNIDCEVPPDLAANYQSASTAVVCEAALRLLHQMLIKDSASIIDIVAAGCHIDHAYKYKHHKSFEDVFNNVDRFDDQFEIVQEMEIYLRVSNRF